MKRIWKYDLDEMPLKIRGAVRPLHVGHEVGSPKVWVLMDDDSVELAAKRQRRAETYVGIEVGWFETGQPIPEDWSYYCGTVTLPAVTSSLVLHLWWRHLP